MDSDDSNLRPGTFLRKIFGPLLDGVKPIQRSLFKSHRSRIPPVDDAAQGNTEHQRLSPDSLQGIDEREAKMIRAILKMEDTLAREIMVPRVDILAAEVNTSIPELAKLMVEGGHSRVPLYTETIDNIFGIVHARDVLRLLGNNGQASDVRAVARQALFIPESKRLEDLLREFQERRVTIAIVVDEYGGVAGLVTMEDLVEEIVGEIEDEFEEEEPEVLTVSGDEAILDARISLEHVNELLSVKLEGDGFDTLGGVVYKQLGKIPIPGDRLEHNGLSIEVLSTMGRRIKKVRVVKKAEDHQDTGKS